MQGSAGYRIEGDRYPQVRSAEPEHHSTRGGITLMIERIPTRQSAGGWRRTAV
jgi:hypothetical protein